jgi:hypothetical protein
VRLPQVKGDMAVTSHYGQEGVVGGNTGNVSLVVSGSTVEVRGDVALQSADAAAGGASGFVKVAPAPSIDPTPTDANAVSGRLYIRGSFVAASGDGGRGSAIGGASGDVTLSLLMNAAAVNSSKAGFLLQTGSGGSGT